MDWQIFLYILVAGVIFSIVVVVLESAALARQSIRQTLREIWQTYSGRGDHPDDDSDTGSTDQ